MKPVKIREDQGIDLSIKNLAFILSVAMFKSRIRQTITTLFRWTRRYRKMGRYLLSYGYIKTKGGIIMLYTKDEYTKHFEEFVKYQHA